MRCFICGAPMEEETPGCAACGNPVEVQNRLFRNTTHRRFLFGRVRQCDLGEPEPEVAVPPRKKPKPKPKPKMAKPIYEQVPSAERPMPDIDLILSRDSHMPDEESALKHPPMRFRTLTHLLDVAICMILNTQIFSIILLSSGRSANPLVHFSLVPLTFVLLSFTGLYFWLFWMLFDKSLARIILEKLVREGLIKKE